MDLRFVELMPSAKIIAEDILCVQKDETVLFVTETRISEYFGFEPLIMAMCGAVKAAGGEPALITFTPRKETGKELPRAVEAAMRNADVIVGIVAMGITSSPSLFRAIGKGKARFVLMPSGADIGTANNMIYRLMPDSKEEVREIDRLVYAVKDAIGRPCTLHLTSANGTDLTFSVGDYRMMFGTAGIRKPGDSTSIPGGSSSMGINYGSANGTLVIDGSITTFPRPLNDNIVCKVENGFITEITGGRDAMEFRRLAEERGTKEVYHISEFGIGMNRKAQLLGEPLEDEHVYGAAHIGIGSNTGFGGTNRADGFHNDGIVLNATVECEGRIIVENGVFKV